MARDEQQVSVERAQDDFVVLANEAVRLQREADEFLVKAQERLDRAMISSACEASMLITQARKWLR